MIAVVNLDPHGVHGGHVTLPLHEWGIDPGQEFWLEEAFTGHVVSWRGERQHLVLDPQINPALLYRVLPADRSIGRERPARSAGLTASGRSRKLSSRG